MSSRKSFQLLVQGTIPADPAKVAECMEAVTKAVEKALLPLDQKSIWIGSQMFASFTPTVQRPAFTVVFGSVEENGPTEVISTPSPALPEPVLLDISLSDTASGASDSGR